MYDYRTEHDYLGETAEILEGMNGRTIKKAKEAVDAVVETAKADDYKQWRDWINTAILPVLKNYAELHNSLLTIHYDQQDVVMAELQNSDDWDLSGRSIRWAMNFADKVAVVSEDEGIVLTLIYNINDWNN